MNRNLCRAVLMALLVLWAASAARAAVTGVVRNGTTGAPAAGVDVLLIQLQGGMETVASTKTDAQGRYRLEHASLGRQPMLVRVLYRGVNFHQPVPPGRDTADVEVYEPTTNASAIQVATRLVALQPNPVTLAIGEEYSVHNQTKPPAAFYKADGSFEFQLPEGAELNQVSAWGSSGMPVTQATIDKGPRRYAIAYAFRPGESGVRLSYQTSYAGNQATLRLPSIYSAARVIVVAPPGVQVSGAGLQAAGAEQGWNVYAHDAMQAGATLEISLSGVGSAPAAAGQQGEGEPANRDSGRPIEALPPRLDSLKWVLVGGFATLFLVGAGFLWRRPAEATSPAADESSKLQRGRRKGAEKPSGAVAQAVAEVDRRVSSSLDELKDTLFRLELRRQAGTISEEEYARERSRTEQVLRELVKG